MCLLAAPAAELRDRWLVRDAGNPMAGRRRQAAAAWFLAASEALGDAALAAIEPDASAAQRVAELQRALDAVTDHELLHQHLFDAVVQQAAGSSTAPGRGHGASPTA